MYQFHNTSVYLVVPFLVAVVLAYKTIDWRELPLTVLGLLILFAPYLYLQVRNNFADVFQLMHISQRGGIFNNDSWQFYRVFVHSFVLNPLQSRFLTGRKSVDTHQIPSNGHSILLTTPLRVVTPFIQLESLLMELFLAGSFVMVIILAFWWRNSSEQRRWYGWWRTLQASPQRQGLLLLLAWQAGWVFMLYHSVPLYIHYEIYLLPGPFIFIALFLAEGVKLLSRLRLSWRRPLRYGLAIGLALLVAVQTLASAGWLIDRVQGNFDSNYATPEYFDLATVHRIADDADQVAQQQHLARVYIDIHGEDEGDVTYLAQFAHTPMEVTDSWQCTPLPDPAYGPVVYVTDSNQAYLDALLQRYASFRLVQEIAHPGGAPLKLYILSAKPEPAPVLQLSGGVQLLSSQAELLPDAHSPQWVAMHWKIQKTQVPQPRVIYKYRSHFPHAADGIRDQDCALSRTWAGDQLFALFELHSQFPQSLAVRFEEFSSGAQHYDLGSLQLVTYDNVDTPHVVLHTADGKNTFSIPVTEG